MKQSLANVQPWKKLWHAAHLFYLVGISATEWSHISLQGNWRKVNERWLTHSTFKHIFLRSRLKISQTEKNKLYITKKHEWLFLLFKLSKSHKDHRFCFISGKIDCVFGECFSAADLMRNWKAISSERHRMNLWGDFTALVERWATGTDVQLLPCCQRRTDVARHEPTEK